MDDVSFMKKAVEEAVSSFNRDDIPVGAVLVIGGELIDSSGNSSHTNSDYISHAEAQLIRKNASLIKKAHKEGKKIVLYTTLEPCIMCLGMCVQSRISEIIYSCPDPAGGATDIKSTKEWSKKIWPRIKAGPMAKETYDLFMKYMHGKENWDDIRPYFEGIREDVLK